MKRQPKVAIYMSCYNNERFVGQAIESILNQTYSNWELFIVNDGSTDKSHSVIELYKDERIHYYNFKENTRLVGAADFLEKIIKEREFDYIQGMASDDWLEPDKLEKQICFLMENPSFKACFTWDKVILEENARDYPIDYSHKENRSRYLWMEYFFQYENCLNANSVLMDKNIYFELGGMNQNYIQFADYRLWFTFASKYSFYILKEELTNYRRHDTNLSNPSIDVVMRCGNEKYRIMRERILPLSEQELKRTFYKFLPYKKYNREEEVIAAKFVLLKNIKFPSTEQLAMDIYFENCKNEKFMEVLKKKYFFEQKDFVDFTAHAGLSYSLNKVVNLVPEKEVKSCSPAEILMTAIDNKLLNANSISDFTYSTLSDFYKVASQCESGLEMLNRVKELLEKIRTQKWALCSRKKIVFIIAADSQWDFTTFLQKNYSEDYEYYVSYVYSMEDYATRKFGKKKERHIPEYVKECYLFDQKNICLYFADELLEEVSQVYYVDSLAHGYECQNMVNGFSLGVTQNSIMKKEYYAQLRSDDAIPMLMMQQIILY